MPCNGEFHWDDPDWVAKNVLMAGPLHSAQTDDLNWAQDLHLRGLLPVDARNYLAIVDKQILGTGDEIPELIERVSKEHPSIRPERIAFYFAGVYED